MRLKSIKLAGFKSFVDPTKVEFPNKITAVVGPNGCGKSNIIDAVRWVMGEISAKYLRGESMADVIFNGSIKRQPLAQASIELHFDNTYGRLSGEYASYNEIVIRRQVSRDGQSHYYLNGTRCRRKDVTNIFLGTGLGSRSYAIIEQGTISRLIEAKPEELRVFLEEAAGVSRYKERRKETEQRLSHTRENLARINDLREELYKQITHLERQAKTAEKYKQLKAEERTLRAQLFVVRYQQLQAALEKTQQQLSELHSTIDTKENRYHALTTQLQQQFDQQQRAQRNLEETQHQHGELTAAIRVGEQNIQHNQLQQQQFEAELKQNLQQQKEADHLTTLDHSNLEQLAHDLESIQHALVEKEKLLEARKKAHVTAADQQRQWQFQWQELNLNIAESSKTAQVEQTRLQQIEARLQQIKQQAEKLRQEQQQLKAGEETAALAALQNLLAEIEQSRETAQSKLLEQENTLKILRDTSQQHNQQLNGVRQKVQQLEGKLSALNTLQQIALGRQQTTLTPWLKAQGLEQAERLANLVEVDNGFEIYLENYLGEKLQAIAINDFEALKHLAPHLPEGNIEFIKLSPSVPHYAQAEGALLVNKIKGPQALLEALAQVYYAHTVEEAFALIPSLPENAEVITKEGVLIQHHWVQIRRSKDEQSGLLQRKREIADLEAMLKAQKSSLDDAEAQQKEYETKIQALENLKQEDQKNWQQLDQRWNQQNAQIHIQRSRMEQKNTRLATVEQELAIHTEEIQRLEAEHTASRELWQQALHASNELNQAKDALASKQHAIEATLAEANRNLRLAEEELQQLRIKEQRCSAEQQGLISQQERTTLQRQQLTQRQQSLQQQLTQLHPSLSQFEAELLVLKQKQTEHEAALEQAKNNLTNIEKSLRHTESERQQLSHELEKLRQQFSTHQIQAEHAQTKGNSLLEQFHELDLAFEEVASHLPAEISETTMQNQLEETQQRIAHLGAVNLAAVSELEGLTERKQFIDQQYQDLTDAVTVLEKAVREIDQETKMKFEETYNTVNHNFQALFPKIFGGGNAYLSLTSEDLLETGVSVFAQPPGKRNSSIHLLSGGEKALTALALVFAIFELNPAPFCMLDEVDAPLDDVNVGRFCNLVQAMSDKTQFIIVTHNKVAMEMADHLMGVTMQEPGVSRLVAVDVEAAIALAAA